MTYSWITFTIATGIAALLFAFWKARWINRQDPGNDRMQEIGRAVREVPKL